MSVITKICGLSTVEGIDAAVDGGADLIGFVFHPKSPRNIAPERAAELARRAKARAAHRLRAVAVIVDFSDAEFDSLLAGFRPDLLQLHGAEDPRRVQAVAARTGIGVIKAMGVRDENDVAAAAAFEPVVEALLLDAKPAADAAIPGGAGLRFDWSLAAGFRASRPWLLAGGLDPWNVKQAVEVSGAPGVDVSSGVEKGPGLKDPALIGAFLAAAKAA